MSTQVIRDETSKFATFGPPGKKRKITHFNDKIVGEKRPRAPGAKKRTVRPARVIKATRDAEFAGPSLQLTGDMASAEKRAAKNATKPTPQQSRSKAAVAQTTKRGPQQHQPTSVQLARRLAEAKKAYAPPGMSSGEIRRRWKRRAPLVEKHWKKVRGFSTDQNTAGPKPSAASKPPRAWKPLVIDTPVSTYFDDKRKFTISTDDTIIKQLEDVRLRTQEFAKVFFKFEIPTQSTEKLISTLKDVMTPELQKIVGCIAVGGPAGAADWAELFTDVELRMALVMGVVGTMLKEHVFAGPLFGGSGKQIAAMKKSDVANKDLNGFERASHAGYIVDKSLHEIDNFAGTNYTEYFVSDSSDLVLQLEQLLLSILMLDQKLVDKRGRWKDAGTPTNFRTHLYRIVTTTALVSIKMRRDWYTIYHFQPSFKDDSFNRETMDCYNRQTMMKKNPHQQEYDPANGFTDEWLNEHAKDVALTRICCFDACVAYRRGAAGKTEEDLKRGFTSRKLLPALVACRWGQARFSYKGEEVGKGYVEFGNVVEKKPGLLTQARNIFGI
ncbi:hypothetical protein H2199_002420 [Coniosporium tulheliwenetii]|uniref:Uncharacterized protein n=1 Tax=Coniosporium tulheliwenetii TaxID=3383036 RepID=A0ACC2ZGH5_9PEZI|nr:hypothetical protein H2199_002420 [Cladosporium sp. JES 115]